MSEYDTARAVSKCEALPVLAEGSANGEREKKEDSWAY